MNMHKITWMGLALAAGLTLAACGQEPASTNKAALVEPALGGGGKTDVADRISIKDRLDYGVAVNETFSGDLEFHGWTFEVHEASQVKLEVTQRGSSRGLDTSLFLYGPETNGSYGDAPIAKDDDSGYGALSALKKQDLAPGRYLVVLGTADGQGRGNYGFQLDCLSGPCQAPRVDVDPDQCPGELDEYLRQCIDELVWDEEISAREAWSTCRDNMDVYEVYESVCYESAFQTAPDFCKDEELFFETLLPICTQNLEDELTVRSDISLRRQTPDDALEDILYAGMDICDGYCEMQVDVYNYEVPGDADISATEAVNAAQAHALNQDNGPWSNRGPVELDSFKGHLAGYGMEDFIPVAQDQVGSQDFFVGAATQSGQPWAGVDALYTAYVMVFPESKAMVILTISEYSE